MIANIRAFSRRSTFLTRPRFATNQNTHGKVLVIVESPAKARTIQKFAPANYIIDSCAGHIRELVSKKDNSKQFRKIKGKMVVPELNISVGDLGIDVENKFQPIYTVIDKKKDLMERLKASMAGCSEVILATDEDREGEVQTIHVLDFHTSF